MIANVMLAVTILGSILLINFVNKNSKDFYFKLLFSGYVLAVGVAWPILMILLDYYPGQVDLIGRSAMVSTALSPYFLILLLKKLFNKPLERKKLLFLSIMPVLYIYTIIFTSFLVREFYFNIQGALSVQKGTLTFFVPLYHVLAIFYMFYFVLKQYRLGDKDQKILAKVIVFAMFFTYIFSFTLAGILPYFFDYAGAIKIAPIWFLAMSLGLSYSILRYQIFNIRLIIKESLLFSGTFASFSLAVIFVFYLFGKNILHNIESIFLLMISGTLLTNMCRPKINDFLYKHFNKDRPRFKESINYLNSSLSAVIEIKTFQEEAGKLIDRVFKPLDKKLIVFNKDQQCKASPKVEIFFKEDNKYPNSFVNKLYDLAVSLIHNNILLGYIYLDLDKKYLNSTKENINLLEIFARQLSIALSNSLSYEELKLLKQNMQVIGKKWTARKITKRQREVLDLLLDGKSAKDIAQVLNISYKTCQHHIDAIYKKFNVHDRFELFGNLLKEIF